MRSTEERIKLLSDSWQKKLNLKEYVNAKYEETLAETPLLDGETGVDKARRQLFYLNMLWFMTNLLDRKDRMSMGASLKCGRRSPITGLWNMFGIFRGK